jgi:hypothetical protein
LSLAELLASVKRSLRERVQLSSRSSVAALDALPASFLGLSLNGGVPLVLVEVKGTDQFPDAGTGQVRGYAHWIKPAFYVITNGNVIVVYSYQGPVPYVRLLDIKRSELRNRFDELYRVINPKIAKTAWIARQEKFKPQLER